MNNKRRLTALIITVCLCLQLAACGKDPGSNGKYRVLQAFATQNMSIGFRNDDFVRYYVEAALAELSADGTIHNIAVDWFVEDTTTFAADSEALDRLGAVPYRTLIVGVDPEGFPMSWADGDNYTGFDVDVARAVCSLLNWDIKFISIKPEKAYVELSSGNVDVAWGGAIDAGGTDFTCLAPYMTNDLVLVVRADSGIRGTGKLRGATLAVDVDQKYMDALDTDESLKNSFGKITRLTGGAQACFAALDSGSADAVIVYSLAANYYGR